ncbi:tetratricopeptide repeat domain containing protein [Acanthamoeba castellanii str. Neff]|uniref:Tetratricopeptide repeat domain containing protein n=1 Tax=Acanthamoeba castellanii (strain ATCC 30010 / Neff) TaxID=1257118 RepID=L8GCP5_ACACF|nr:tetratricopeptide repeat domain containing protein [Acanthamoeba castellanii str. Neff]ELR10852.1 tetratricopeptide repeat domain containing protein [Acanthamoeba castellanii str. Neff]
MEGLLFGKGGEEHQEWQEWLGATEAQLALREAVVWSLERGLPGNATWLAERLWAMGRTQGALGLLATARICPPVPAPATATCRGRGGEDCCCGGSWVCFQLGRLKEAHDVLLPQPTAVPPMGAAGFYLLGQVLRHQNQRGRAVKYLRRSLELQPYLWSAYEALCALGEDIDAAVFFAGGPAAVPPPEHLATEPALSSSASTPVSSSSSAPGIPAARVALMETPEATSSTSPALPMLRRRPLPFSSSSSSSGPPSSSSTLPSSLFSTPPQQQPQPQPQPQQPQQGEDSSSSSAAFATPGQAPVTRKTKKTDGSRHIAPRRSTRLSFSSAVDKDTAATPGGKRKSDVKGAVAPSATAKRRKQRGEREVMSLLRTMGNGVRHLCQFRCEQAIATFGQLSPQHRNTAWVMCQVARAHFEMVNYGEAERLFAEVHRAESTRTEGMEIYSTILWHLRKEVGLSHLAQQLVDADKMCPQAWCALGNCFSLQKEHQTAIKFFQRATEVDGSFAYGHTLCGHEYVASDDLEKALACFRTAVRIDPRHYNAWFGIGLVFYRQERYELAEYHFRKALAINHTSSILKCYIGMEALAALDEAIVMNPTNGLAKYKRACVLFALGQYTRVVTELQALALSAPKETSIHCLLGKARHHAPSYSLTQLLATQQAHKRLGDSETALRCFHTALDMDTKNQTYIKGLVEKVGIPDDPHQDDPLPDLT